MLRKLSCNKCPAKAVWVYGPDGTGFCEKHVHRSGCSCMLDDEGMFLLDDLGRVMPCIEYDYYPEGFIDEA